VDLIFCTRSFVSVAAAFHRWIYASGGRQLPCVTVLCCVIFIWFIWFVVEGNLLTSEMVWNKRVYEARI
jgi:hypothetical protein